MKAYLAGPWFNPEQLDRLEKVKKRIVDAGYEVFSPKDEILYEPGVTQPNEIVNANCEAIDNCELIVVITDGKDVGTIWEAGYAYGIGAAILYFWEGGHEALSNGAKFNVMLAATGFAAMSWTALSEELAYFKENEEFSVEENSHVDAKSIQ